MTQSDFHFFAPSQVDTFKVCQRKWAFKSLLMVPTPQNRSAALGDEVHKQLETYLKGGVIDFTRESGYIAGAVAPYLPDPKVEHIEVERKIGFEFQGFAWSGRVDWTWIKKDGISTIGDHKTTRNFRYAKTANDLLTDPQGIVYAYDGMLLTQQPKVRLCWDYVTTEKPYTPKLVEVEVESANVVQQFKLMTKEHVVPMSRLLHLKRKKGVASTPEDVTKVLSEVAPTPDSCEAFGGCPYRMLCTDISAASRMKSILKNSYAPSVGQEKPMGKSQDLFASLLAKKDAAKAPETPASPPPAASSVNPPQQEPSEEDKALVASLSSPEAPPAAVSKKRGRPKKPAESESFEEGFAKGSSIADLTGAAEELNKKAEQDLFQSKEIKLLYVDCFPLGASRVIQETSAIIEEAKAIVNEQLGVCDFRVKGFGEGQGALCSAVEQLVKQKRPVAVAIETGTPEGDLLLVTLTSLAYEVVRGIR